MSNLIRFGVSLDAGLLEKFDALCGERGYGNRSEAIRDLIRNSLVQRDWDDSGKEVAGSLSLVFDHHAGNLAQRLTCLQHDFHPYIIASLHVHLDHDNCLENLVLKGPAHILRELGQKLISTKGVKHGSLTLATTGRDLA
ncbi:MAG: nickel-responsive transcriptional regulator NikR [Deltaproteobacteria bacterium]|jgi:CopG family nickel-responsive transcriptional regulator|nr:nickel-responsive transcriptional regulator NikR [Deltaproteobacteria bacterium]